MIVHKNTNLTQIIDFAIPYDTRVVQKENEKMDRYQDLAREIKKLWDTQVEVIPIIIGALGTIPTRFDGWLEKLDIVTKVGELQKTVLLHSARILRKVLER